MDYHIVTITYGMAFVEPVVCTGWSKYIPQSQHILTVDMQLANELSTWVKVKGIKLVQTINFPITDHANTNMLALNHFPTPYKLENNLLINVCVNRKDILLHKHPLHIRLISHA